MAKIDVTPKGVAVTVAVITRFLARADPTFAPFVAEALSAAQEDGLSESDLSLLRALALSIGAIS